MSVGACLIMLIAIDGASELADADNWEPTRLVGQVVSGIGFLGAGTILQKKERGFGAYYSCNFMAVCRNRTCSGNRILQRSGPCNCNLSYNSDFLEGSQRPDK